MENSRYRTVKTWATVLLIFMLILYVTARSLENTHAAWHWVRAFAEAGMIGALADWFAVVALFRHPLGLPIPHTAIVKNQKDKIGASLGKFVRNHFLTPVHIAEQVRKQGFMKQGFTWLSQKENASRASDLIEVQFRRILRDFNNPHEIGQLLMPPKSNSKRSGQDKTETSPNPYGERDEAKLDLYGQLSKSLSLKLAETPIERGLGVWMTETMNGQDFRKVVSPLLHKLSASISDKKMWVEEEAQQRAPMSKSKILSKLTKGVTSVVSSHIVLQVSEALEEASKDLNHSLYDKLEDSLLELGNELREEEEHSEWSQWRERIFSRTTTHDSIENLLRSAVDLAVLEKDSIKEGLTKALSQLATRVSADPDELKKWEDEMVSAVTQLSTHYGDAFEELIQSRFREWDADSLAENLEKNIGADLQFIRINGTLIGGAIGAVLYGLGLAVWGS